MIRNTNEAWGWPARAFHWLIALMIVVVFAFGLWMTEVPVRSERPFYFSIHASIGITLLIVLVARYLWSLVNATPDAPAGTPAWQHRAARLTHGALYALTFATAVIGWLLGGVSEPPLEPQAFGLLPMPPPLSAGRAYEDFLEEAHELTAYALIAVAGMHTAVALWHHFVLRDNVLRRMLSGKSHTATVR